MISEYEKYLYMMISEYEEYLSLSQRFDSERIQMEENTFR